MFGGPLVFIIIIFICSILHRKPYNRCPTLFISCVQVGDSVYLSLPYVRSFVSGYNFRFDHPVGDRVGWWRHWQPSTSIYLSKRTAGRYLISRSTLIGRMLPRQQHTHTPPTWPAVHLVGQLSMTKITRISMPMATDEGTWAWQVNLFSGSPFILVIRHTFKGCAKCHTVQATAGIDKVDSGHLVATIKQNVARIRISSPIFLVSQSQGVPSWLTPDSWSGTSRNRNIRDWTFRGPWPHSWSNP